MHADSGNVGLHLPRAEGRPQTARPGIDGRIETAIAVGLTARHDGLRTRGGQHGVHPLWKRLERRPLRVTATQHGIAQARCLPDQRIGRIEAPFQRASAVRRTAVVSRRHDDERALLRQRIGNGIQRRHLGIKACTRCGGGNLFGNVLAGTEAAAIQHVHRFPAAGQRGLCIGIRRRIGLRRHRNQQPLARIAQPRTQAETVRFERQRLLDVERIVVRI